MSEQKKNEFNRGSAEDLKLQAIKTHILEG